MQRKNIKKNIKKDFSLKFLFSAKEEQKNNLYKYWDDSKNVLEFVNKVLDDESLNQTKEYWKLAKEMLDENQYMNHVIDYLTKIADNNFIYNEAAGITIGNESFSYNLSNDYRNGVNRIFVIYNTTLDIYCLNFETILRGTEINLYKYNLETTENRILGTLKEGEYWLYSTPEIKVFKKMREKEKEL